jgi:ATP-dependent Clp protease adapter protein ClpS
MAKKIREKYFHYSVNIASFDKNDFVNIMSFKEYIIITNFRKEL